VAEYTIGNRFRVENIGIGMANIRAGAGADRHNRATH